MDDIHGRETIIPECFRTPLCHPVWTGDALAIAVLCENRLLDIWTGEIAVVEPVGNLRDILVNGLAVDPFVIVSGGGCNREIIAFVSIPFCIYPV